MPHKYNIDHLMNFVFTIPPIMVLLTGFAINNNLTNGNISGQYVWFSCSVAITAMATFFSWLKNGKIIKFTATDKLVVLFCVCAFGSGCFNDNKISIQWIILLLFLVLYFCFVIILNQSCITEYLLVISFLITGLIEALWGMTQLYGLAPSYSSFKISGSFFNPGPFAGYLALLIPLVLYYILSSCRFLNKPFHASLIPLYFKSVLSIAVLVAIILVLPATMSRSAWIIAIIGSAISVCCFFRKKKSVPTNLYSHWNGDRKKLITLFIPLFFLGLTAAMAMYYLKKNSADGRAFIWKISFKTALANPLGVGIGNFPGAYGNTQSAYFTKNNGTAQEQLVAGSPEYAFNDYLQIAVEFGWIPLFVFIALMFITISSGIRTGKFGETSAFISLMLLAFLSYPFRVLQLTIALIFLMALCRPRQKNKNTSLALDRSITTGVFVLFLNIAAIAALYYVIPIYNSYNKWKKARVLYNNAFYAEATDNYEHIYPSMNHQVQFLFEYAQILAKTERYELSNHVLEKAVKISCDPMLYNLIGKNHQAMKRYPAARENYLKAASIIPGRLYPYYLLTTLYHEMGDGNRVCQMAEMIQTKEVKIHSPAVLEMKNEMKIMCAKYKNNNNVQ